MQPDIHLSRIVEMVDAFPIAVDLLVALFSIANLRHEDREDREAQRERDRDRGRDSRVECRPMNFRRRQMCV